MSRPLLEVVKETLGLAESVGDTRFTPTLRLLTQRVSRPEAFVSVVGETSTGKSTLVNALLQAEVLPASAAPTSGTVTQIVCRDVSPDRLLAIFRDATQTPLTAEAFREINKLPPPELLRLQVQTNRAGERFQGFNVIDTPGYNAVVVEHEEVLRGFLPQSDAIVLVAGYRTGFGQGDQDLYDVVRTATAGDDDIPFFLVINRAPPGAGPADKRVGEILRNAKDSLRRPFATFIVTGVPIPTDRAAARPLPDTAELWSAVYDEVRSDARRAAVEHKLRVAIGEICGQLGASVATQLGADAAGREVAREKIEVLREGRERSLAAVEACMAGLRSTLPVLVRREGERIRKELAPLVDDADKWLGQPECTAFILEHALPHEGRRACDGIEQAISSALEELDRVLEEIANTTVQRLHQQVRPSNDAAARVASDLSRVLAKRVGGTLATNLLQGVGGVGGVAAGAGNVVKMIVKRVGKLVDHTFSREVYTQIGRIFNKRMVTALGSAAAVVFEGAIFAWDAHRWRSQLKTRLGDAIGKWEEAIQASLLDEHLVKVDAENRRSVQDMYDHSIADAEAGYQGLDTPMRDVLERAAAGFERIIRELAEE